MGILLQYSNRQHLHQLFQTHHTNPNTTINNNTINMTDDSRKGLGDKVQEKVTPQESKSTTDKVKEGVTNTADKAQRDVVPDDQKSSGQAAADKASRTADSHSPRPTINPFVNQQSLRHHTSQWLPVVVLDIRVWHMTITCMTGKHS